MVQLANALLVFARKASALAVGTAVGAGLTVIIWHGSLSAIPDTVWILDWILKGRPLGPGEVDDTWYLRIEWTIALNVGCILALLASAIWALLVWRRLVRSWSAAALGAVLGLCSGGFFLFATEDGTIFVKLPLIGCAGAIAGLLTFWIDQAFARLSRG